MSRRLVLAALAIGLGSILVLSLAWGLQHAAMSSPTVLGQAAPALTIAPASGAPVRIKDLQGEPIVLNFWASWCGPCVEEGAVLDSAATSNPKVRFVGADNRDTLDAYRAFEARHPHVYPAGPIVFGTYQSYGVAGLPATFFIDSRGTVIASFVGPLDDKTLYHYLGLLS